MTLVLVIYSIDNIIYIGYRWSTSRSLLQTWTMSFTQELTCRWSTSKWTPTKLLQGHLLHRSCYTGVQPSSRWSNCIWTLEISYFSSSSISVWRQGQPGGGLRVDKCGFCLSLGNPLRRSRVSDGVKCESSLPPATSAEIVWTPKHVVESDVFLGTGSPLQRSRRSGIQTCGKGKLNFLRRSTTRSHEMRVKRQKLVWNLRFSKFRCKHDMKVKRQ